MWGVLLKLLRSQRNEWHKRAYYVLMICCCSHFWSQSTMAACVHHFFYVYIIIVAIYIHWTACWCTRIVYRIELLADCRLKFSFTHALSSRSFILCSPNAQFLSHVILLLYVLKPMWYKNTIAVRAHVRCCRQSKHVPRSWAIDLVVLWLANVLDWFDWLIDEYRRPIGNIRYCCRLCWMELSLSLSNEVLVNCL